MQWIAFSIYLLLLLTSSAAGIILAYQTQTLTPLAIPSPFFVAMQPIIRFLFGSSNNRRQEKRQRTQS
jgi:hypothetical protein